MQLALVDQALLAGVTEAHPDASYIELLRLFKVLCSARLQLALIEKALLADVTAKNPDASYIELLRHFEVRRRIGTLSAVVASGACCIVFTAHCPRTSAISAHSRRT